MGRLSVLAIGIWLLYGCATAGAEATMLSDNTALISASANTLSERAEIVDSALKQAANITSAHGYRYFVILSADNTSSTLTVPVPGDKFYIQSRTVRSFGSSSFSLSAYPGATYQLPDKMLTRIKPGLDIIIQMYRQGEIDPNKEGVWNADVVLGRVAFVEE